MAPHWQILTKLSQQPWIVMAYINTYYSETASNLLAYQLPSAVENIHETETIKMQSNVDNGRAISQKC